MASIVPDMDWSPLANLGKQFSDNRQRQAIEQGLVQMGLPGNMNLAQLALQQQAVQRGDVRDTRDYGLRREQFDLSKKQAEATLEGNRVPAGFRPTQAGGLAPIPGGPEDPAFLRQKTDATDKGRQMSITDITKLTEEGQKFGDLTRFESTFKPEYAGYKVGAIGNIANIAGRNLPEGVVGKDIAEGATWWQGYDRYKNVVRHELYGAALTKPETAAFEAADITPGMTPAQITKNLALQKSIVENGLKRKGSAMVQAGYDPKAIGSAYGVDLGSIGVDTTGKRGAVAPSAAATAPAPAFNPQQAAATAKANPQGAIAEARAAIQRGADPAMVAKRLQELRIDPAVLNAPTGPSSAGAIY